jgi:ATP-dependent RNA helicase DeaD
VAEAPSARPQGPASEAKSARAPAGKPRAGTNSSFRVEVGSAHGVKPGNLVGAIANEAGLEARHIGRIEIFDLYSLVELPAALPKKILAHLQAVQVAGRALRIREDGQMPSPVGRAREQETPAAARGAAGRSTKAMPASRPPSKERRAPSAGAPKPVRKKPKT